MSRPSPRSTRSRSPGAAGRRRATSSARGGLFGFVQLEFGYLLGPPDGRYLIRDAPDEDPQAILVLRTLGAPERRGMRARRGRAVSQAEPEPVPTSRASVVRPEPFAGEEEAELWLEQVKREPETEIARAERIVNRALAARRLAAADPYVQDVAAARALAVRVGYGEGEAVADGRFAAAWEVPAGTQRRGRRSMESPDERFAALVGGREDALPSEELVLRARADLNAGRAREAALQARIALESVLADLGTGLPGELRARLDADRTPLAAAANAALKDALPADAVTAVSNAVERMETALRRRRLGA